MQYLPSLFEGINDTMSTYDVMAYLSDSIASIVKVNAPANRRKEVAAQADLTSAIIKYAASIVDMMPEIPEYDNASNNVFPKHELIP